MRLTGCGGKPACVRSDRVPDAEVIPGVKWGRPEWVPSAAYWAAMSEIADNSDDFVSTETTLKEQVGFCLLGGFGITAEMNHAIFDRLDAEGIFRPHNIPTAAEIERLLRLPVNVEGKLRRYRFPNQRSSRLATALRLIEEDPPSPDDPRHSGTRGSDDVAILDIHIIRAGVLIGLFDRRQKVPKDYDAMEARFLEFAAALQVRPSLLDAVMWREMRQLGRGPV